MQKVSVYGLKVIKRAWVFLSQPINQLFTWLVLFSNGINFTSFKSHGIPKVNVGLRGKCTIGSNFRMNNRESSNPIGRFHRCSIIVGNNGNLSIGKNVGMSSTAIVCHDNIEIGNNVQIGGNVVIYDTDFHSLNSSYRMDRITDVENTKTKPVKIGNNVFIGAHSTILKGIQIGDNAIVGACSVVTKSIPDNEVWAGNPVGFIRTIQ
jgi:acetyltransferase-like isoleucine patch superfamily enzyme